jgi:nicotinamidase-related amidase
VAELAEEGRQALLVMDMQRAIVGFVEDSDALLARTRVAIAAARASGLPVLFVVVRFRSGLPEISRRNLSFGRLAERGISLTDGEPAAEIHPALGREDSDPIVVKLRVSAFAGSDLAVLLRAAEVDHLVRTGIVTSGVVLSTVRLAADLDYRLTVLGDCCADRDPEVHRVLLEKVFPTQARVLDSTEWARGLRS